MTMCIIESSASSSRNSNNNGSGNNGYNIGNHDNDYNNEVKPIKRGKDIILNKKQKIEKKIITNTTKSPSLSSYYFLCNEISNIVLKEAFNNVDNSSSGIVQCYLYKSITHELLQYTLQKNTYLLPINKQSSSSSHSKIEIQIQTEVNKTTQSLSSQLQSSLQLPLQSILTLNSNLTDHNDENITTITSICKSYSSIRPLLEFIWLSLRYAFSSSEKNRNHKNNDKNSDKNDKKNGKKNDKNKDTNNGSIDNNSEGILKILSLDCKSRSEPFIICGLYEKISDSNCSDSNGCNGNGNDNNNNNDNLLRMIGFIEVEIDRSTIAINKIPTTPVSSRSSRSRSSSELTNENNETTYTEKILLNIKSMNSNKNFDVQTVDVELFRECLQKRNNYNGKNSFHLFIDKLISLYV